MNTARLIFGWLFLAGFTAAGTYYAMDEADQRVGLSRFQFHEKLGLVRSAAVRSPINTQTPPINNQLPPINNQNPPINNQTPPISQTPPVNNQIPPINQTPPINPPINNQTPPTNNQNPPVYQTPPANNQNPPVVYQPPTNNQTPPGYQPPSNNNQRPPFNPQIPPGQQQQQQQQPRHLPADTAMNERLIEVKSRAGALKKTWDTRKPAYGTLRPEIQTALSAMMRYVRDAEAALQQGNSAAAKQYLDQAEKQMEKLQEFE